jgi:hypothetical protein
MRRAGLSSGGSASPPDLEVDLRPGVIFSGPTIRSALLASLAAMCALLLTSCGTSGSTGGKSSSGQSTSEQELAARLLNLKSSDFPSSWSTITTTTGKNAVRSSFDKCIAAQSGAKTPATTAISSNFLDRSTGAEVGSQVQLFDSATQASANARIAGDSVVGTCLQSGVSHVLPTTLEGSESLVRANVTSLTPPTFGSHPFGQRTAVAISHAGPKGTEVTNVYVDMLGFDTGTALIATEFENTGTPPTTQFERKTMETLAHRASTS